MGSPPSPIYGCQMAIARFLDRMCLALRVFWTMATLHCKICHLATLSSIPNSLSCFHLAAELSRTLMKVGRPSPLQCRVDKKERGARGEWAAQFIHFRHANMLCGGGGHNDALTRSPCFSFRLHPLLFHYIQELNTCSSTSVCGRAGMHLAKSPSAPFYRERRDFDSRT